MNPFDKKNRHISRIILSAACLAAAQHAAAEDLVGIPVEESLFQAQELVPLPPATAAEPPAAKGRELSKTVLQPNNRSARPIDRQRFKPLNGQAPAKVQPAEKAAKLQAAGEAKAKAEAEKAAKLQAAEEAKAKAEAEKAAKLQAAEEAKAKAEAEKAAKLQAAREAKAKAEAEKAAKLQAAEEAKAKAEAEKAAKLQAAGEAKAKAEAEKAAKLQAAGEAKAEAKTEKNAGKAVKLQAGKKNAAKDSLSLSRILRYSLVSDPRITEAYANEQAAKKRADASFALHYPTVQVQGNRILSQQHDDKNDEKDKEFKPAVVGKMNLFSWGAINNQVKRDRQKERYFYYKYYETREELGLEIGTQYLNALYFNETLMALRENLARHLQILGNLEIIVRNDPGRRSEWVQAKAREVQVRQNIATYETNLQTALSRLAKYLGKPVAVSQLTDPFAHYSPQEILKYARGNVIMHPTYMAQQAEMRSVQSDFKSTRARQLPSLNLEAIADKDSREIYATLSWDLFDRSTSNTVAAGAQDLIAAENRLEQVFRDINERSRTAEMQMAQGVERIGISAEQIKANKEVVNSYELQFKIARKTLIELLNAYNDLAVVEMAAVNARNDFRTAALAYLHAQNNIALWAGVPEDEERDGRYLQETGADKAAPNT